jgi:competence protein ComEA
MSQNIKLAIIILIVGISSFVYHREKSKKVSLKIEKIKLEKTYTRDTKPLEKEKLNVNNATLEDYLKFNVSLGIAKKIYEYKNIVGRIENLKELDRISGIGEKTVKKLSEVLVVGNGGSPKKLKINKATEKELTYFGLSKKEIKKIKNYKRENGIIYSNVELMEILGEKRYREYEERIDYN